MSWQGTVGEIFPMTDHAVPPRPAAANNIGQAADADNNNRAERNNNNIPQHPLLNVRDRLFHALFYRMATVYARAVPMPLRTTVEYGALFMVGTGILLVCFRLTNFQMHCNLCESCHNA